jgi:hypothetical protein
MHNLLASRLTGRVTMTLAIQPLHEPYAHLYVGDYFTDTLDLSAHEHCALRLLLLETWVRGPVGNMRLARVAGLTKAFGVLRCGGRGTIYESRSGSLGL